MAVDSESEEEESEDEVCPFLDRKAGTEKAFSKKNSIPLVPWSFWRRGDT